MTATTRTLQWSWDGQPVTLGVDESGDGPLVLFLPALSSISTRGEMRGLLDRLPGHLRGAAVDWPGFGETGRLDVRWTPDALSAFLDHLLTDALPDARVVVAAGHAAAYALHFAARHPGRLAGLALVAPTWRGPLPTMAGGQRPVFAKIRRAVQAPVAGPALYRLNMNPLMVRKMVAGHVYSDPAALSGERLDEKRRVMAAPGARFGSAAFVTGGLDRMDSREAFLAAARDAGAPLAVIYGEEAPPKSRAEMEALAGLPGVRAVRLPRGKLGVHEEFPDDVAPVVAAFCADVLAG